MKIYVYNIINKKRIRYVRVYMYICKWDVDLKQCFGKTIKIYGVFCCVILSKGILANRINRVGRIYHIFDERNGEKRQGIKCIYN